MSVSGNNAPFFSNQNILAQGWKWRRCRIKRKKWLRFFFRNFLLRTTSCWNPKCILFWIYPPSSGLLSPNQALHFFPSYQFYSSLISPSWEEQIWIVAAVRGMKAANGGPAHTWPHNLTSESAFSRWREGRLGQIATEAQWLSPKLWPANFE